ncbi:MAG: hypothetical protein M3P49_15915 [Actinomycetota bacterium]|nr:hypothetical protein [Actinomycetota bacterium]
MQPEEALELIGSAGERYDTVRAVLRYRGDGPTIRAVRERFLRSEAGRRTFGVQPEDSDPIPHAEPDGPFGWRCRIWRVDDHRWRQELELPGGGVEIASSTGRMRLRGTPGGPPGTSEMWERRVGGGSRSEDPSWLMATDTFWTMYPFDPAGFCSLDGELGRLDLRAEAPVRWAGREAVRLVGVPVEEWEGPPEPLWWGADEYEAVVDAERGVVLRLASRLGGEDFDALEIEEIHFDERFPKDTFDSREPLPWR